MTKPEPWWPLRWIGLGGYSLGGYGLGADDSTARPVGHPVVVRVRIRNATAFFDVPSNSVLLRGKVRDYGDISELDEYLGDYAMLRSAKDADMLVIRSILLELAYPGGSDDG